MSRSSTVVALALPGPGGWDFGDYPYALEPLTMPHPHERPTASDGPSRPEVEDAVLAFLAQARQGFPPTDPADHDGLERLFWFRWMIGHHISFVLWRLLAEALGAVASGEGDQEELARTITQYVRAYSGMMLYTGSSNREIYNCIIRPSMYRQHRTFSGTWALDYPPVRSLFHGRRLPPVAASESADLAREVKLAREMHFGVAAKLVVGGKSLLQAKIREQDETQPRMWGPIFDAYFLTLRAPVSAQEIVAQLLRRQKAVAIDLATNGLYPLDTGGPDEVPGELRRPAVLECQRDLTHSLCRVVGLAAGLTLDRVNKELGLA